MTVETSELPPSLRLEQRNTAALLTICRQEKRNALDDVTVQGIGAFFACVPRWAKVVVLAAEGDHFSAGLDMAELTDRDAVDGMFHSRGWHASFAAIQSCGVPVIAVLKGAVVGGGLELATAAHMRVAESSAFFALPEGARGLFVGGGASVRVSRLIGVQRMTDLMLTGRVLSSDDGLRDGLVDYLVADEGGLPKALELAERIAQNSPVTNYAVLNALPRIAEVDPETGLLLESLMSAVAQSSVEAKTRLSEFLAGKAEKVAYP